MKNRVVIKIIFGLLFIIIGFFIVTNDISKIITGNSVKIGGDDDLGWVIIEHSECGLRVTIVTEHIDHPKAKEFGEQLVRRLAEEGYPVREDLLTINYRDAKMEVDMCGRVGKTVANGTAIFLEKAADYCDFLADDVYEQIMSNELYLVNVTVSTKCGFEDFVDVMEAIDIGKIVQEVNLQKKGFFDEVLYKNTNKMQILDLDEYFECNEFFEVRIDSEAGNVRADIDSENVLSLHPKHNFVGEERMIVNVTCNEYIMEDYFFAIVLDKLDPNNNNSAPKFNNNDCGLIEIAKNTDYTIDLDNCFSDPEDDTLDYRNDEPSISEINISKNFNKLIIEPKTDYIGEGFVYVYATDGYSEASGKIIIEVKNKKDITGNGDDNGDDYIDDSDLKISYSRPGSDVVYIEINSGKTFSIKTRGYDEINWLVDSDKVEEETTKYNYIGKKIGEYNLTVEVIRGEERVVREWLVIIDDYNQEGENSNYWIYLIIVGVIIVIVIVILIVGLIIFRKFRGKNDSDNVEIVENIKPEMGNHYPPKNRFPQKKYRYKIR